MSNGYTGGEPAHFVVKGETMMIRMARDSLEDCFKAATTLGASAFVRICAEGLGVFLVRLDRPLWKPGSLPDGKLTSSAPDKIFPLGAVDGAIMWALVVGEHR